MSACNARGLRGTFQQQGFNSGKLFISKLLFSDETGRGLYRKQQHDHWRAEEQHYKGAQQEYGEFWAC